jgi:hypothetical protein
MGRAVPRPRPRLLPAAPALLRPPSQRLAARHTSAQRMEPGAMVRRWVQPRGAARFAQQEVARLAQREVARLAQQEARSGYREACSVQREPLRLQRGPPRRVSSNPVRKVKPKGSRRAPHWAARQGRLTLLVWGQRRGPVPVATSRLTPVTMRWRTRRARVASCVHLRKVPMNFACLPLLTVRVSVNRRMECGLDLGTY